MPKHPMRAWIIQISENRKQYRTGVAENGPPELVGAGDANGGEPEIPV